jgi:RimJ/RimL family protein N-acetyltransferase
MPLSDATTARLRLSRWEVASHTPALEAVNARPEAVRYLNDGRPYSAAESRAQSERFAAHWARHGFGLWAVTELATGRTVGFVGLAHPLWFPAYEAEVEVGWRLHPDAWGNGYATEAGRVALAAAAEELGLARVISAIDPDNAASIAVAERLDMSLERTVAHPQRPGNLRIYAIALPPRDAF